MEETGKKIRRDKYWIGALGRFLRSKFDLDEDKAQQSEVVENIGRGVEFRGTNLWVLIFATFIASLGLNVNSAAVIIGAMLISPLMGPIMGIGLSLGINDFELMKRSLRNFGFMVLVSILTSTLYFWVSPLSTAQSELLARTMPTTYDVMIAFFGGLAGIVAQSRKDRTSTVIPGVAIATALMPPLCTAGFGLATGQLTYFFGAFYLFFINTVFIAFATFFIVRFLKYDKKVFLDKARERKVRRSMILIIVVTIVPSVVIAYRIVQQTIFETNADRYVNAVFRLDRTQVVDYRKTYKGDGKNSRIELLLMGDPVSEDMIESARAQLLSYGLYGTELTVRQPGETDKLDFSSINVNYAQLLEEKNRQIARLQERLERYAFDTVAVADISREAGVVVGNIAAVSLSRAVRYDTAGRPLDTAVVCMVKPVSAESGIDEDKLAKWLQVRTRSPKVKIYVE